MRKGSLGGRGVLTAFTSYRAPSRVHEVFDTESSQAGVGVGVTSAGGVARGWVAVGPAEPAWAVASAAEVSTTATVSAADVDSAPGVSVAAPGKLQDESSRPAVSKMEVRWIDFIDRFPWVEDSSLFSIIPLLAVGLGEGDWLPGVGATRSGLAQAQAGTQLLPAGTLEGI